MNFEIGTVIAPHCDDEALGCMKMFEEGLVGRVVVVTDSAKQVIDPYIDTAEYIKIRRAETMGFCEHFKVRDVIFMNYPDGSLNQISPENLDEFYETMLTITKTSKAVYFPSIKDSHPDHRFVAGIMYRLLADRHNLKIKYGSQMHLKQAVEYHITSSPVYHNPITRAKHGDRLRLFREFFPSQSLRLRKTGFDFEVCLQDKLNVIVG